MPGLLTHSGVAVALAGDTTTKSLPIPGGKGDSLSACLPCYCLSSSVPLGHLAFHPAADHLFTILKERREEARRRERGGRGEERRVSLLTNLRTYSLALRSAQGVQRFSGSISSFIPRSHCPEFRMAWLCAVPDLLGWEMRFPWWKDLHLFVPTLLLKSLVAICISGGPPSSISWNLPDHCFCRPRLLSCRDFPVGRVGGALAVSFFFSHSKR